MNSAPLTFGQLSVWHITRTLPPDRWPETYLRSVVPVPSGISVDNVVAAVDRLCQRHESLRTHFVDTPAGPRQIVVPDGRAEVTIVDCPNATFEEATELSDRLAADLIDQSTQFGRRFAVVTDHGQPRFLALVVDHIVADGTALYRLRSEFAATLGAADPAGAAWIAEVAAQPRELAVEQHGEGGRRSREAAFAYWRDMLRTLPADVFPVSVSSGETPGRIEAVLRSARARGHAEAVAARVRVSDQAVLLALTVLATAVVTGRTQVVLTLQSGNRFHARWKDIVSSMNQYAPMPVVLDRAETPFTQFAAAVQLSGLKAYRRGMYDIAAVFELVRQERDLELGFDCFFNFVARQAGSWGDPELDPDAPARVEDRPARRQVGPRFDVMVHGAREMPIVVRADPSLLTRDGLRGLLLWYDEELRRMAGDGDVTVGDLVARCGQRIGREITDLARTA